MNKGKEIVNFPCNPEFIAASQGNKAWSKITTGISGLITGLLSNKLYAGLEMAILEFDPDKLGKYTGKFVSQAVSVIGNALRDIIN